jgi:hypothetical protein
VIAAEVAMGVEPILALLASAMSTNGKARERWCACGKPLGACDCGRQLAARRR